MQYMGGKTKIAKKICAKVRELSGNRYIYIEPFMGGGSVLSEVAPCFDKVYASDVQEDLILMWKAAQDGWIPPKDLSEQEYHSLRHSEPSPLRAFAGFGCSFGAKWFGGYARNRKGTNYAKQASNSVVKRANSFRHAEISQQPYWEIKAGAACVVYCDPPYAGTQPYSTGSFDHVRFWEQVREWSRNGALCVVSEYKAPDDFEVVLEISHRQQLCGLYNERPKTTERLFTFRP